MYKQGFEQLLARNEALPAHADPASFLSAAAEAFVDFAAERPSRYQLLFQRTVPGFVPSEESYAVAKRALEGMRSWLAAAGLTGRTRTRPVARPAAGPGRRAAGQRPGRTALAAIGPRGRPLLRHVRTDQETETRNESGNAIRLPPRDRQRPRPRAVRTLGRTRCSASPGSPPMPPAASSESSCATRNPAPSSA